MALNQAFKNPDFWLAYEKICHENNDGKGSDVWLAQLAEYFTVKTEQKRHVTPAAEVRDTYLNGLAVNKIETEFDPCDDTYTELYRERFETFKTEFGKLPENQLVNFADDILEYESTTMSFDFPLPHNYQLKLLLDINRETHDIPDQTLYLVKDAESFQLGYWDTAHWLPFCLRLQELNQLEAYWQTQTNAYKVPAQIAWALLAKFIGIIQEQDATFIRNKYQQVLDSLGIKATQAFPLQSRCAWQKTEKGYEFVGVKVPEYLEGNLDHLSELGMDIEALKMMSYSLRKQSSANVEGCTKFPFEHWAALFTE